MSPAIQEAIEIADAQVNNFGLPTYSELLTALRLAHDALFNENGDGDIHLNAVRAIDIALDKASCAAAAETIAAGVINKAKR